MERTERDRLLQDVEAFCRALRPIEERCYLERRFNDRVVPLAREHGLHTCPQESWSGWYREVAEAVALPSSRMLFSGIAMGYRDDSAPINRLRTGRATLEEFATFRGFG